MSRFVAMLASAGTGKTYSLTLRYLAKLFLGASPQDILAITFTNKAANEMRTRIHNFLENLDEEKVAQLTALSGLPSEEIHRRLLSVRTQFLNSRLNIRTIDSFVQAIVRKFAGYIAMPSDFAIEEMESYEAFIESMSDEEFRAFLAFAKWYGRANLKDFFALLYAKQKELPALDFTPCDGAGAVMEAYKKIAAHIEAFGTEKKREEFCKKTTLEEVLYTKSGTIPAWLTREEFKIPGVKEAERIQAEFTQLRRAIAAYFRCKEATFLSKLFYFFSLYSGFRQELIKKREALDFTDIKHLGFSLIQEHIESDFLRFRLDSKIAHILFDEFQDTSAEDWKIIEPLVEEMASGIGQQEERSFFLVGDKKQAIYGFRGGNAALFDYVIERFSMEQIPLYVNYRSRKNIVEYVNEVFAHRLEKPQEAKKDGGYVEVCESEELLDALEEKIAMLRTAGVEPHDIAILVPTNNDIIKAADHLESLGYKASTSASKLLIHQPHVRAIIALMKYQLDPQDIYAFEFEAISGHPAVEVARKKPAVMIRHIADRFGLWDEAVKLLIQEAVRYKDLWEFAANIDRLDVQMSGAGEGIEVMTIHKSKGLAFKHTIVLDTIGQDRSRSDKIIFDLDEHGINIDGIYLRQKGREKFDKEYDALLNRQKERQRIELENVAYVAMTRAEDSLILIKKPKTRRFWMAKEVQIGQILPSQEVKEETIQHPFDLDLRYYGKQEILEEEEEYKANDYEAIYKGQALHSALEIDAAYAASRYGAFVEVGEMLRDAEAMRKYVEEHFKGSKYREIPFVNDGKLGIIDLLIDSGEECIIVDYKSAVPHDESAYRKQVLFYMQSVKKLTGKRVRGFLLYGDRLLCKEVK